MPILKTYLQGWGLALQHLRLWGLLYVINFLFALLVSFPVFRFLEGKLAHSMALDKMFAQFDFTIYNDIMNEYGDVVGFLFSQGIVTSGLFLLVTIFFVGGILNVFRYRKDAFSFAPFWTGGAKFYGRIFLLTLLFLVLQGVVIFLFYSLFGFLIEGGLDRFHSEAEIYKRAFIVFPFYVLAAIILWMIQDYTKVVLVTKELSLWSSLKEAIVFIRKNFLPTFLLYALNLLIFSLLFYLYWRTPTSNSTALVLLVGQAFLIFRIGTKLVNLGTAALWYDYRTADV